MESVELHKEAHFYLPCKEFTKPLPSTISPVESGQKWLWGRSQVCLKRFCSLLFICSLPKSSGHAQIPFVKDSKKNVSPNILRNCNKSLDIFDFYLLPLAVGLYTWYVQKYRFTTNQTFVTMFYLHSHAGMDWKFYWQCGNWIEPDFLQNAFRQTDTQVARFWNRNHSVFCRTRNHCLTWLAPFAYGHSLLSIVSIFFSKLR